MPTVIEIEDTIYEWVDSEVSIPIVWDKQPEAGQSEVAVQPAGTYIKLSWLVGPIAEGFSDDTRNPLGEYDQVTKYGQRDWTLSVEALGSGAHQYMIDLQNSLRNSDAIPLLKKRQQSTVSVAVVASGKTYIIMIGGTEITYTSLAGATAADIRDGLIIQTNLVTSTTGVSASAGATDPVFVLAGRVGVEFDLSLSLGTGLVLDSQINAVDIAVIGDEGIVNVSEFLETVWDPRHNMDVPIRTHVTEFKDGEFIESAEITGTISGNDITIEIP